MEGMKYLENSSELKAFCKSTLYVKLENISILSVMRDID